jgi:hypothetical protein
MRHYLGKTLEKRDGGVTQGVGPEFKSHTRKKKKKRALPTFFNPNKYYLSFPFYKRENETT